MSGACTESFSEFALVPGAKHRGQNRDAFLSLLDVAATGKTDLGDEGRDFGVGL